MALHQIAPGRSSAFQRGMDVGHRARTVTVRRRQVVLALLSLMAVALVVAIGSGSTSAWWAVAAVLAVGATYLGLLHRSRRRAAERAFGSWATRPDCDFAESLPGIKTVAPYSSTPFATPLATPNPLALARFMLACVAGWALSPVVFLLSLLVREMPRDATSQRWLANLQLVQERLRDQSLRTIVVSAATTASVTATGAAALTGAGAAGAATIRSSAGVVATASVTAAAPTTATYTVLPGDTLWGIAQRFGTTVATLAGLNHIADENLIYAGEVLRLPPGVSVPVSSPAPAPPSVSGTYIVRPGDTLWSIGTRFGLTVSALAATNDIPNPNLIYAGQVLRLRGTTGTPVTTSPPVRTSPGSGTRPVSAPPKTSQAAAAVQVALAQVGKPYVWGGAGPSSFDCSGLVMYAWARAGVDLPHYSVAQYEDTERISEAQLRPGDLVFYDTGSGAQPGHVTIYIGGDQVVTADEPGTDVRVVSLTWDGTPMGFGRVR
ncbi:MAG TPA: LysM peptidoglycan-binding domain-containing protein [Acidimicrobiales bacterium]|nr:LysM peptidoglycan-binding domain-containing protein [Acidimicrobiales bacterium]